MIKILTKKSHGSGSTHVPFLKAKKSY